MFTLFDFFTLFEIIQEDEETERVRYNALLDEEDEANEALAHKEVLSLIKENENDSAYASKVGNYSTVFELFTSDEFQIKTIVP